MKVVILTRENTSEILKDVLRVLRDGRAAVIPTDTVYGLAADALNPDAVRRVFEIKRRSEKNPLPVFVSGIGDAETLAEINERQRKFLEKVSPGKVTCVLKARKEIPEVTKAADGTIALRIPNHDFALTLLHAFGRPLTGTSANISGSPPHIKIQELIEEFKASETKPDLIIDAGDLAELKPSTIIDLTSLPLKILREGAVSREELQKIADVV